MKMIKKNKKNIAIKKGTKLDAKIKWNNILNGKIEKQKKRKDREKITIKNENKIVYNK
jgi:hypothetical protein